MSTKADAKTSHAEENDWDQDDDNWDDWGDAEDNFEDAEESHSIESNEDNNKSSITNNNLITKPRKSIKDNEEHKDDTVNSNSEAFTKEQEPHPVNTPSKQTAGWSGLFGGVVSSVLSTASDLTSTVSQGLNQVIGAPDPEELARMQAAEAAMANSKLDYSVEVNKDKEEIQKSITEGQIQNAQQQETDGTPVFGLSLVSGVTSLGTKVLNTGLDTLEGIGKKTMHILQENDPLLINKRKLLGLETERPNLSEILKEAKKDADSLENTLKELKLEKSREMLRFDLLFENHCGLVHFEALEILSKESTLKLQKLKDAVSGNALNELQDTIDEVKELLELEDLEGESDGHYDAKELNARLIEAIQDADLQISFDDIANHWTKALEWLNTKTTANETNNIVHETFACGITTLAEACALEMNKLHKIAELLLVKEHHSTANEVDCIVQLCKQFTIHLTGLTNRFATALTSIKLDDAEFDAGEDEVKTRVSILFAEMLVATQEIEKAYKLFLPILQIGAV